MIRIRPAIASDVPTLTDLGRTTFVESFEHLNNPVNFQRYLDEKQAFEVFREEFNKHNSRFYIAEYDSQPAGFCKLVLDEDEGQAELLNKKCMELEKIYVLKQFQGLHLGYKLFQTAYEIAQKDQYEILWLGVWEKNEKAINIYKKWGFEHFSSHDFDLGGDIQTDLLMKLHVKPIKQN